MAEETEPPHYEHNRWARALLKHLYDLHIANDLNEAAAVPDEATLRAIGLPDANAFKVARERLFAEGCARPAGTSDQGVGAQGAAITREGRRAQETPGKVEELFPTGPTAPTFVDDGVLYAVLDSNCFIEFPLPRNIDWAAHLGAKRVCVVVPAVIIGELNSLADGGKLPQFKRQRAKDALKEIEAALMPNHEAGSDPVKLNGTTQWMYAPDSPPRELFEQFGLERDVRDDRLAATVYHWWQRRQTCLVSDDTGARMRVRALRVRADAMPEGKRLTEPNPEEELRKQNRALMDMKPKLVVHTADGSDRIEWTVPEPREPVADFVAHEKALLEAALPLPQDASSNASPSPEVRPFLQHFHGRQVGSYREARREYLAQADKILPVLVEHLNRLSLFVPLREVFVVNEGTHFADGVEVYMELPDELELRGPTLPGGAPPMPQPPKPLQAWSPKTNDDELLGASPSYINPTKPRWIPGRDGSLRTVRIELGKLREGDRMPLADVFLQLRSFDDVQPLTLRFIAHTDSGKTTESTITLALSKGPMRPLRLLSDDS